MFQSGTRGEFTRFAVARVFRAVVNTQGFPSRVFEYLVLYGQLRENTRIYYGQTFDMRVRAIMILKPVSLWNSRASGAQIGAESISTRT